MAHGQRTSSSVSSGGRVSDRRIRIRKIAGRWTWVCWLCHPEVHGATLSYDKTIRNVTRHCIRTRPSHHEWVRMNRI